MVDSRSISAAKVSLSGWSAWNFVLSWTKNAEPQNSPVLPQHQPCEILTRPHLSLAAVSVATHGWPVPSGQCGPSCAGPGGAGLGSARLELM